MIDVKIKGLDKLKRKLKRLENNMKRIDGKVITTTTKEKGIKKIKKKIFEGG